MLNNILTDQTYSGKRLLAALYALFSLRAAWSAILISSIVVFILFVFSLIMNAIVELCCMIAQVWAGCNSIERLLLFFVAWLVLYKSTPVAIKLYRKGRKVL